MNATVGSAQFYLTTFFTDAIWLGAQLLWGNRHCFSGHTPRELARNAAIGTALIVLFILGRLIVRLTPLLAKPASDLLDNMRHGSVPITLTTLFINGVGEELFFRDVARRPLA
ncbi:CPBP family intramembrane glutamate endopeptidase, partial [Corynebacterium sp. CTNIH16]|nr:CPBP family intramembrane glutamate endopeptidase [Corynebacterium sp. CTNIH16]